MSRKPQRLLTLGGPACAAVLAVALTAACGNGGTHDAGPAPAALPPIATLPAPSRPPTTDLTPTLLTAGDLPAGFVELTLPGEDTGGAGAQGKASGPAAGPHTQPAECARVLTPLADQVPGAIARAQVHYSGPAMTEVDQDSASYRPAATSAAFASVQRTLHACTSYTETDSDGTRVSYRLGALSLPRFGDGSVAFELRATGGGTTLVFDVILAAVGADLTQIAVSGQQSTPPAVLTAIGNTAAAHLAQPAS